MHARDRVGGALAIAPGPASARRDLTDDKPDRQQDKRGLDVVGTVDAHRHERLGQEEVERERRGDRRDCAGSAAADDRRAHDDEHEDQREVRVVDVIAERNEHDRDRDRAETADHDPDRPAPVVVLVARHASS